MAGEGSANSCGDGLTGSAIPATGTAAGVMGLGVTWPDAAEPGVTAADVTDFGVTPPPSAEVGALSPGVGGECFTTVPGDGPTSENVTRRFECLTRWKGVLNSGVPVSSARINSLGCAGSCVRCRLRGVWW